MNPTHNEQQDEKPVKSLTGVQLKMDVFEAALGRIRWLFDEFDNNVCVSVSGGKDSTVVMELAARVARERGVKLKVFALDQEAEWEHVHNYLAKLYDREDIEFYWYQIPFKLGNAASMEEEWIHVYDENLTEDEYVRPRHPRAIKENPFKAERFTKVLDAISSQWGRGATLTGVRIEESMTRRTGATSRPTYKWVTWGRAIHKKKEIYTFHPIYDWSYRDVWHAIETEGWDYNPLYDRMFQHGIKTSNLRVSSLLHEHALTSLREVQEIEPETWNAVVRRFPGVNSYKHVGLAMELEIAKNKPYMFDTWMDYLDYLVENLPRGTAEENQHVKEQFEKMKSYARRVLPYVSEDQVAKQLLKQVLRRDYYPEGAFGQWVIAQKSKNLNNKLGR